MPNWCSNNVEFQHSDPAMIKRLADAFNEGKLMREFHPYPAELDIVAGRVGNDDNPDQIKLAAQEQSNLEKYGFSNWYDWCVNNWGTKWDINSDSTVDIEDGQNSISVYFDSAWSPPIGFYEHMEEEHGFKVKAFYYEPGMAFCGIWDNGSDVVYEITGDSTWVTENIPSKLDEMFAISEMMSEYESEEELNDAEEE